MGEEQYLKWIKQIKTFMKAQGESKDFIAYVVDWLNSMKGSEEVNLVQNFHPAFKDKSDQEAFNLIVDVVRHVPQQLPSEEFSYHIFNSAFLFYRPLLKLQYLKEQGITK